MAIDFSDLGGTPIQGNASGIDFSDLGGQRIDSTAQDNRTGLQKAADFSQKALDFIGNPGYAIRGEQPPQVNEMSNQGDSLFNKLGTKATEYLAQKGIPGVTKQVPGSIAAIPGTIISLANPQNWMTPAPEALPAKTQLPGAGIAEDIAQSSGRRALGYTKGMLKKPGALDRANTVAQTMLDKGVIRNPVTNPLSFGAEGTFDRAQNLADQSGQAIGSTISDLSKTNTPSVDTNAVGVEISNQLSPKLKGGAYDAEHNVVNEILDTVGAHGNGPISFESAQALKQKLGDLANFSKTSDAMKATMYRRAYGIVSDAIDNAVANATQGTQVASKYASNKALYGASKEAEKALLNRLSSEAGNKRIGLTDMIAAGGELAAGNPGTAAALVGLKHGFETAGNATAATVANYLAKAGTVGRPTLQAAIAGMLEAKSANSQASQR